MARLFGSISIVSFLLAAILLLGGTHAGGAVLARALRVPEAAPSPPSATCSGITVTGAHPGCLVFVQIICRAQPSGAGGEDAILVEGVLTGTSRAAIQVTPNQTRFGVTIYDAAITVFGGPPRTFDIARGADLDADVGQPGTPSASHLKGFVSCGI